VVTNLRIVEVEADAKTLQAGTAIMKSVVDSGSPRTLKWLSSQSIRLQL